MTRYTVPRTDIYIQAVQGAVTQAAEFPNNTRDAHLTNMTINIIHLYIITLLMNTQLMPLNNKSWRRANVLGSRLNLRRPIFSTTFIFDSFIVIIHSVHL